MATAITALLITAIVMAGGITAMVIKADANVVVMVAHPVVHIATKEREIICLLKL